MLNPGKIRLAKILTLLFIIALFTGCADLADDVELAGREVRDSMPSQEFDNALVVHTNKGDTSFTLVAPTIYRYDKTDYAKLDGGINVKFYRDGVVSSTLTAKQGEVIRGGKELKAIGNVVVKTDSGMTIYTPVMTWTERDHKIRSDTTVTLISEQDTLYGTGLIATDDLKERTLLEPSGVTRRKAPPEDADSESN